MFPFKTYFLIEGFPASHGCLLEGTGLSWKEKKQIISNEKLMINQWFSDTSQDLPPDMGGFLTWGILY